MPNIPIGSCGPTQKLFVPRKNPVPIFTGSGVTVDVFAMSHPMRLYADPGTTLHMLVVRNQTGIGTAAQVDFKFSGYLEDLVP